MKGYSITINPATGSEPMHEWTTPIPSEFLRAAVGGDLELIPHFSCMRIKDMEYETVTNGIAYCNEEGKHMAFADNTLANMIWASSFAIETDGKQPDDRLVGPVIFIWGDEDFMAEQ